MMHFMQYIIVLQTFEHRYSQKLEVVRSFLENEHTSLKNQRLLFVHQGKSQVFQYL